MAHGGLRYYLARLNIAEKLIAINLAVFILTGLASALLGFSTDSVLYWFELPKDFFAFLSKPWSLVTYSFFHAGIGHIFWNMLILYFTGRIFLNLFDSQRFINVYFLGVILGGLVFLLSYNIFPTLLNIKTSLIGASAGVTAVLIFICAYNTQSRSTFAWARQHKIMVFGCLRCFDGSHTNSLWRKYWRKISAFGRGYPRVFLCKTIVKWEGYWGGIFQITCYYWQSFQAS